ncbi:MAG: MotA/TolQ/ExbB proton channel family protein [Phycisphaeraceae bacterium]
MGIFVEKVFEAGWMMVPLFICSIVAVAVIVERMVNLRHARVFSAGLINRAAGLVRGGDLDAARAAGRDSGVLFGTILDRGINEYQIEEDNLEEALMDTSARELPKLERFLIVLSVCGSIAPLMGLFGTVYGMIISFEEIASTTVDKEGMARGISIALITTGVGLIIAIPSLIMNYYFRARLKGYYAECEEAILEIARAWKLHRKQKIADAGQRGDAPSAGPQPVAPGTDPASSAATAEEVGRGTD